MESGSLNRIISVFCRLHYRCSYAQFSKLGISPGEPRILRYLKSHEGCIQRQISKNCHLEPATVTHILAKMERENIVERHNEPGNRRNLQVFLTRKGHEHLSVVENGNLLLEEQCFRSFTPEEKKQAASFLHRMCENLMTTEEHL